MCDIWCSFWCQNGRRCSQMSILNPIMPYIVFGDLLCHHVVKKKKFTNNIDILIILMIHQSYFIPCYRKWQISVKGQNKEFKLKI